MLIVSASTVTPRETTTEFLSQSDIRVASKRETKECQLNTCGVRYGGETSWYFSS